MSDHNRRRVQLLIERHVGYRTAVLEGIFQYGREVGNWIFEADDLLPRSLDSLRLFKPHGVIAGLWDLKVSRMLLRKRVPLVDVFDWFPSLKVARVHLDNRAIGEKAARFLIAKGFKNFGFFGHHSLQFSVERREAFQQLLAEEDHTLHIAPAKSETGGVWSERSLSLQHEKLLGVWRRLQRS